MAVNVRELILDLKSRRPVKFFEAMPELVSMSFINVLERFGLPKEISAELINERMVELEKKLNADYNIKNILIGAAIWGLGRMAVNKYNQQRR